MAIRPAYTEKHTQAARTIQHAWWQHKIVKQLQEKGVPAALRRKETLIASIICNLDTQTLEKYLQIAGNRINGRARGICFGLSTNKPIPYLIGAILKDKLDHAQVLLSSPLLDVNIRDCEGRSALHVAASRESVQLLDLIIKNPNIDLHALSKDEYKAQNFLAKLIVTIMQVTKPIEKNT